MGSTNVVTKMISLARNPGCWINRLTWRTSRRWWVTLQSPDNSSIQGIAAPVATFLADGHPNFLPLGKSHPRAWWRNTATALAKRTSATSTSVPFAESATTTTSSLGSMASSCRASFPSLVLNAAPATSRTTPVVPQNNTTNLANGKPQPAFCLLCCGYTPGYQGAHSSERSRAIIRLHPSLPPPLRCLHLSTGQKAGKDFKERVS